MSHFTASDREICVRALQARLDPAALQELIPDFLLDAIGRGEMAEMLVDLHGLDALRDRNCRGALVASASDEELADLLAYGQTGQSRSRGHAEDLVVGRNWHPGKGWAAHFVKTLGLPDILRGVPDASNAPPFEVVTPYTDLPPLHPYQEALKQKLVDLLNAPPSQNRGILSLPTGAGKTRTAVEAIVQEMAVGTWQGATILWIAQTEELCEQALAAFRQVWLAFSVRQAGKLRLPPLQLCRVWAERSVPEPPENGIAVAGIDKLRKLADSHAPEVEEFFSGVDAVVIDEAHRAMAPEYTRVLGLMQMRALDRNKRPLIGLTATPYRTNSDENRRLARRFGFNLLTPGWSKPMEVLQEQGILSHIKAETVSTHYLVRMNPNERRLAQEFKILPSSVALRVGRDRQRNDVILGRLLHIERDLPTLFFACSVQHAQLMSLLLRRAGRSAAALTAETPRGQRRAWIEAFREGDVQFLCNYDILTTGFDAPRVAVVAVGRPTTSELVYEQMIGRGLRGPANGGTDFCTIIDFVDAFQSFGEPMSYACYEAVWQQE